MAKRPATNRKRESETVARVLRAILQTNPKVPGVPASSVKDALEYAINLFEVRAIDADTEEG